MRRKTHLEYLFLDELDLSFIEFDLLIEGGCAFEELEALLL